METTPATLFYSAPLTPGGREDNWQCDAASHPPDVISNFLTVKTKVEVGDVRTAEDLHPTIDACGFQKFDFPTRVDQKDFMNHGAGSIEAYIQETKDFLKDVLSADEVLHFDTCIRQKDTEAPVKLVDNPFVGPYQRVHVDQNPASARARLKHHAGPDREVRRFQIINVWRAFVEPVKNFPLALLDYRSLDPYVDLVVTRRILPEWMHERWVQDREGYSLKHREEHRWYHWSALTPKEVVIFKCHDSASRSLALSHQRTQSAAQGLADSSDAAPATDDELMDIAGLCPHTAFFDARGPATGHLRSSADLRFLVLYN
jgi:cephamycin C biosynthesis protein